MTGQPKAAPLTAPKVLFKKKVDSQPSPEAALKKLTGAGAASKNGQSLSVTQIQSTASSLAIGTASGALPFVSQARMCLSDVTLHASLTRSEAY